jgi:hypothetical protein
MGALKLVSLTLAAAVAAVPTPASGQCRLCSKPITTRDEPKATQDIQLEVETSIDFDRLIIAGEGDGAAVIRPDGSRAAEGSIAGIGGRAMVGTATVRGDPGRAVRVELPRRIDLYSLGGGRITFDEIVSDLPSLPRLDSAGRLAFRFGGRIKVTGDAGGQYRGDLPITVEYQ